MSDDFRSDAWRSALWLTEAHPVTAGRMQSVLRMRKAREAISTVLTAPAPVMTELHAQVVPGAPFLLSLMWWLDARGVDHEDLRRWNLGQSAAGHALRGGGRRPADIHHVLVTFARARVAVPDIAFSDGDILTDRVRRLLAG
jgi:hypothetical protein